METVSMLINVGNRQLNLKVPAADQENILKAEKLLNDKIAVLRKSYAVNDNQDILAMCAFSIAGELISQQASGKKPYGKTGVAGCIIKRFSGAAGVV